MIGTLTIEQPYLVINWKDIIFTLDFNFSKESRRNINTKFDLSEKETRSEMHR